MDTNKIAVQVKDAVLEKLTHKSVTLDLSENLIDLGLDDLDKIEIVMKLEEVFMIEISDDDADQLSSIGDLVSYIEKFVE
ncbi:hypothetical protein A3F06_04435 [candidate division TM6 bacterium RIFCSPHIGHO2_12_FULL_36_22]|nr:MAG: hypothetical protein A3F06_04435 [candidate division TM6 bacterium RIFCSPHIGHO2_12_FULL_36_22]